MRLRSFIIAYALVLAILLFADRRPHSITQDRYSHVVDLTDAPNNMLNAAAPGIAAHNPNSAPESRTRIIAPDSLIPGTWTADQIPPERLIAPLVVMDVNASTTGASQISLDDIAAWEAQHGTVPQGAIVAICRAVANPAISSPAASVISAQPPSPALPITADAARFLMDARYTTGFAVETPASFTADRTLARQIALHGNYIVESTAPLTMLPATGSLIIVAPAKDKHIGRTPVRVLAMVK